MSKISISYRRADSEAMTGRIFDRLINHYGKEAIFRDIEDIPAGIDFRQHINETLLKTNVLLAIVGPKWLGAARGGVERINEESDPVRVEVETALRRRVPIIPVLIGNTRMPSSDQLPSGLKDFAFRNAVKVDTGQDFDYHVDRLIKSIDTILGQTKPAAPSKETAAPSARPPKAPVKTEAPPPPPNEELRRTENKPRASATAAVPLPQSRPAEISPPQKPGSTWRETLWPKSRQGRMIRLAAAAAGAIVVAALLIVANSLGGSGGGNFRPLIALPNSASISALAFSPDGQVIAAASLDDKSINLWDVAGGKLLNAVHKSQGISSIAFLPDGKGIAFGELSGAVVIADAGGGQSLRSLKPDVGYVWVAIPAVWSIAASPDGTRIASGDDAGNINFWSTDGQNLGSIKADAEVVKALAFFPDGKMIVSGGKDGTVGVWNALTGAQVARLTGHSGEIMSVAVSPDGRWIAAGGDGNTVLIWSAATDQTAASISASFDTVQSLAFSADSSQLIVGGDGPIEIWSVESARRLQEIKAGSGGVRALALSADRSRLASGGTDGTINVWSSD
jgi:TIR domain/WD domain, G-beta repeat